MIAGFVCFVFVFAAAIVAGASFHTALAAMVLVVVG